MVATSLKICPFCGGPGDIEQGPASQASGSFCSYRGWCDHCRFGLEWTTDQREAIDAWNRRSPSSTPLEPSNDTADALVSACRRFLATVDEINEQGAL